MLIENNDNVVIKGDSLKEYRGFSSEFIIPRGIKHIDAYAFENCEYLEKISIPSSVKSIGENAFIGCINLKEVHIEDIKSWCDIQFDIFDLEETYANPLSYADQLFLLDKKIDELILPKGIENLNILAFKNIKKVKLSSSLKDICPYAFEGSSFECLEIPEGVENIYMQAFAYLKSLKNVSIPDSIVYISETAFEGCDNLEFNQFDNALYLGNEKNPYLVLVKAKSENITTCIINNDVKIIMESAFIDCNDLQYNQFDDGLYLGSEDNPYLLFIKALNTEIETCIVNNKTKLICNGAFSNCFNLRKLYVYEKAEYDSNNIFNCCHISEISVLDDNKYKEIEDDETRDSLVKIEQMILKYTK